MKLFRILCIAMAMSSVSLAQEFTFNDDFSSGNLEDYNFVDQIGSVLGTDFAQLTTSDGSIRVLAPTTPDALLGPARAGFEFVGQPRRFTDFEISVDIIDWDESLNSGFGLTARTRELTPLTLDMYFMGVSVVDGNEFLVLNRFDDEVGIEAGLAIQPVDLNPDSQYRLMFSGVGPELEGNIFDIADLTTSLATVSANDTTYVVGGGGVAVGASEFDPAKWLLPNASADVTFDNYSITATVPEPSGFLVLQLGILSLLVAARRTKADRQRTMS